MDLGGGLTFLNHFALELFGFTPDDFTNGIEAMDVLLAEDQERALENMQQILQQKNRFPRVYCLEKG
jgi:PAS domain-containing protein